MQYTFENLTDVAYNHNSSIILNDTTFAFFKYESNPRCFPSHGKCCSINRYVVQDLQLCLSGMKKIRNGVVICCDDDKSLGKLKEHVSNKLGTKYEVSNTKLYNPRIMIKNIQIPENSSVADIIDNISSINDRQDLQNREMKFVTKLNYPNATHLVLEMSPEMLSFSEKKKKRYVHGISFRLFEKEFNHPPLLKMPSNGPPGIPDKDAFINQLLENNKKQHETIAAQTKLTEKMSRQIEELQAKLINY
ncbi:unnamed protein product [Acanthoscelides obtectus]|uniref:Uncharacterized protein n=1 Tax=Acanthoscelides obtectus TaxID=200917 RepID=A0A9P0K1D7_ACAOB|nr:unnamed protein product [Acanthoscelides obtectus]CAK1639466.1 hypothetical protein AOBTE_LOCUS11192 [Acanthoscelides obtectus]